MNVKLLGTPIVQKDKEYITFPFGKAEALFYYMLVKKRVSRDVLVDLFWANVTLASAKKNLRNAVYIIKKVFNEEVLVSPQRTIIELNSKLKFKLDIDEFLFGCGINSIEAYSGEFLEGFFVKDAKNFEEWMLGLRSQYRYTYVRKLYKQVENFMEDKKWNDAEKYCNRIIDIDQFDEKAYRVLMKIYNEDGKYNKCIYIYNSLVELLDSELSIAPDTKTTKLFEKIAQNKPLKHTQNKAESQEFFYGRNKELDFLSKNYYRFLNSNTASSIIILGETGIGKSKLLNRFLDSIKDERTYNFVTNCYQAEEKFLLKPWHKIFQQLSLIIENEKIDIPLMLRQTVRYIFPTFIVNDSIDDSSLVERIESLSYETVEKTIFEIFNKISIKNKIILAFEDLQWIDSISLALLKNIMLNNKNRSVILVATCRQGHDENIENFLTEMGMYEVIKKINLQRLSKRETVDFISEVMSQYKLSQNTKNLIYKETEGNPLFIVELLTSMKENGRFELMTPKLQDVLKNRFLNVSIEGRKILNIISAFFDKVTFQNLQQITLINELELIEIIEELQNKYLVKEVVERDKISFIFTHQKLREFIYSQLSSSKKRLLHNKIANLLEKQLKDDKRDNMLYSKLIYHFDNGGDKVGVLKYSIKNLENYLSICHEVFPVIYGSNKIKYGNLQFKNELSKICQLLEEVQRNDENNKEIIRLEISFLHILGRYYIMKGDYDVGLAKINEMIEKSLKLDDYESALRGYMKIIYYCINTHNVKLMSKNISKSFEITKERCQKPQIGILLRLKGLQKIMEGKFNDGEEILKNSINVFNVLEEKEKYISNIAASHNYIGESKRYRKEFKEAILHYEKSISICESRGLIGGLTVSNTNAGQAAYDMGDYEKAKKYFNKAIDLYKQFDLVWGRATANGYFSMLLIREGKYDEALKYIKKAERFSDKVKSPYEKGLIYRVKAEISKYIKDNNTVCSLSGYLNKGLEKYCDRGIEYLKNVKGCYEIEILKKMRN